MKATLENVLEKRKSREGARGQEKFGTLPSHKISLDQTIRRLVSKKTRVEGVREEAAKRGGFPELWQDHFE